MIATITTRLVNERINLGVFGTEEDAAKAYDLAATTEWGEYALLNFPKSDGVS